MTTYIRITRYQRAIIAMYLVAIIVLWRYVAHLFEYRPTTNLLEASYRKWNWHFAGIAFLEGIVFGSLCVITDSLLIPTAFHTFFLAALILKATHR